MKLAGLRGVLRRTRWRLGVYVIDDFDLLDDDFRLEAERIVERHVRLEHPELRILSGSGFSRDGLSSAVCRPGPGEAPEYRVVIDRLPGWARYDNEWRRPHSREGWYMTVFARSLWIAREMRLPISACPCVGVNSHGCEVGRPYPVCLHCNGKGFVPRDFAPRGTT